VREDPAIEAKRAVAEAAAAMVEPGMRVGLGSGSTALLFVEALGKRLTTGLTLPAAVATSRTTADRARAVDLALADMEADAAPVALDIAVDGADEIGPHLALVKGGGGCLTREKIVASMAKRFVVIADGSKRVERLGRFPLPVEVLPFAWRATAEAIAEAFDVEPVLRRAEGAVVVTDNGGFVLDCPFERIDDPQTVAARLSQTPGVVEHGLFLGMADLALVAGPRGVTRLSSAD
jgi:ribose 5-phosphate isomerase A